MVLIENCIAWPQNSLVKTTKQFNLSKQELLNLSEQVSQCTWKVKSVKQGSHATADTKQLIVSTLIYANEGRRAVVEYSQTFLHMSFQVWNSSIIKKFICKCRIFVDSFMYLLILKSRSVDESQTLTLLRYH